MATTYSFFYKMVLVWDSGMEGDGRKEGMQGLWFVLLLKYMKLLCFTPR